MTMMRTEHEVEAPTAVIANYLRKTVSVSYLIGLAWAGRLLITGTAVLGFLLGIYLVYSGGPLYTATIRVAPASNESTLSDVASAGGLLAGLAGGAGATQVPKFTQFLYALGSVEVAQILDRKYDLLCHTFRGECDAVTHQWKPRRGIREFLISAASRLSGLPDPNVGPRTATDLADYIGYRIVVTQIKKADAVYSLTYTNRDPKTAAQFLTLVVKATNDYIRAQNREMQERYVDYLTTSAAKATNVEQRQAIDTLLLQEERQLMMTEVDIPYAAKILDGPTVAPANHGLRVIAICTFLGLMIGLIAAMSRNMLPHKWRVW